MLVRGSLDSGTKWLLRKAFPYLLSVEVAVAGLFCSSLWVETEPLLIVMYPILCTVTEIVFDFPWLHSPKLLLRFE